MVARVAGTDPTRAPLLIHGHLDVVPADEAEWTVHPFSGEVQDGYVWGRGAIDMKNMDAMTLAVLRNWARQWAPTATRHRACLRRRRGGGGRTGCALVGRQPSRPVRRLLRSHQRGRWLQRLDPRRSAALPDPDRRERDRLATAASQGQAGPRFDVARRQRGHASCCRRKSESARHEFPVVVTDTVRRFLEDLGELTGLPIDPDDPEPSLGCSAAPRA